MFKPISFLKIFTGANSLRNQTKREIASIKVHAKDEFTVFGNTYERDDFSNITERIVSKIGKNLHVKPNHPLSLVRQKIIRYFYKTFVNSRGNPLFSVYDNLPCVVSVEQNFETLLIPQDHPSRAVSDCYYLNRKYLLRAHTTAHQLELVRSGLNNFLIVGDVYRRDAIDSTHYPIFHQVDAVRLRTKRDLFPNDNTLEIFENGNNTRSTGTEMKQSCHSLEAVKLIEHELKSTLIGLSKDMFGNDIEYRWVETYFPFTQPSWELEIYHGGHWMEVLGCGIINHNILRNGGVEDRIGWAFGLGLERIAMYLFQVPDIRLFWSTDSGFLNQFKDDDLNKKILYKPISHYPQCFNDISFWLPQHKNYASNDFYDLVRDIAGDIIEQVTLVDEYTNPKSGLTSHCYRVTYRHMEKTLTKSEVNLIHKNIEDASTTLLGVAIR